MMKFLKYVFITCLAAALALALSELPARVLVEIGRYEVAASLPVALVIVAVALWLLGLIFGALRRFFMLFSKKEI
jgi:uncharacterized protein HemY